MSFSQSQIPDMLRAGAVNSNPNQRIDTDVLDPVVSQDGVNGFIRFNLMNKGLLNPASRITFSTKAVAHSAFYSMGVGVGGIVAKSTLKIGGKTICEVQDFPHYFGYKSSFVEQEVNKERESFMSARSMANEVVTEVENASATYVDSKFVGIDSGREPVVDYQTDPTTPTSNTDLLDQLHIDNLPVFSIRLDDLIPALRNVMLPLYTLTEEVQIELQLTDFSNARLSFSAGFTTTPASDPSSVNTPLDLAECQMIADYTFLSGDAMAKFASNNPRLDYTFLEPRMTRSTLATQADANNQIRNIGGAGRFVNKVFAGITSSKMASPVSASGNSFTLLNSYRAIAPSQKIDTATSLEIPGSYSQLTTNIKKNDRFLYPIDRKSSALHYHGVNDAEGAPIECTRDMYARQGSVNGGLTDDTFEGHVVDQQLSGQYFYNAYRMNDGERVNFRGLELHNKLPTMKASEFPLIQRVYIEMQKVMVIDNGIVDCYYR